ncbi:MAG: ATP-binding protein [Eudoraea sp.]
MVSRNIYLQLVVRILLISAFSLGIGLLVFKEQYFLTGLLGVFFIILVVDLIRYVNHTNRKIAYFFDAIQNEDFTLRFPEKLSLKSLEELNHSLNTLNEMIQDIHLKKQTQEQYYQEIMRRADIGILTFNEKGHIIYSNPTAEKLFNYKPLNHIKQLAQVDKELYEIFEGLKPFDRKLFQFVNEREKRQLALSATAINLEGDNFLLVVVQDIHRELDEKETDSWVRLIRVLTHEIMNTIAPITSISESVLKYFKKEDGSLIDGGLPANHLKSAAKGLEVIKDQGNDLISFVQSYRSLLSLPDPDKEIVSAAKLLKRVKLLLNSKDLETIIKIEIRIQPANLEFFLDEKQITQVLVNLGKNAQQSMEEMESGLLQIFAGVNSSGKKFIEVRDNGPGIAQELIEEIFVPFFTTKNSGTGIGLSLSKQIMRLHGGGLEVHSTPNKNTSFILTF